MFFIAGDGTSGDLRAYAPSFGLKGGDMLADRIYSY